MSENIKYEPVGHRIVVKMEALEEFSKGGLVLIHNERAQAAAVAGTVIAIGPDAWFDKNSTWAQIGDKVIVAKYAGFSLDEKTLLRVINDEDILARVTEINEVYP